MGECCRTNATRAKEEKRNWHKRVTVEEVSTILIRTFASVCLQAGSRGNVSTHTHLILQRRCPCHATQWGLSINEWAEGQMTPFMLTMSRSQRTYSSFPAELWFGATETKLHSSTQIKRCFFTPTANERLLKPNWRRVCSQELKRMTDGWRQWARQLLPAQSPTCQLMLLIWAWCYRCASNSHPTGWKNPPKSWI